MSRDVEKEQAVSNEKIKNKGDHNNFGIIYGLNERETSELVGRIINEQFSEFKGYTDSRLECIKNLIIGEINRKFLQLDEENEKQNKNIKNLSDLLNKTREDVLSQIKNNFEAFAQELKDQFKRDIEDLKRQNLDGVTEIKSVLETLSANQNEFEELVKLQNYRILSEMTEALLKINRLQSAIINGFAEIKDGQLFYADKILARIDTVEKGNHARLDVMAKVLSSIEDGMALARKERQELLIHLEGKLSEKNGVQLQALEDKMNERFEQVLGAICKIALKVDNINDYTYTNLAIKELVQSSISEDKNKDIQGKNIVDWLDERNKEISKSIKVSEQTIVEMLGEKSNLILDAIQKMGANLRGDNICGRCYVEGALETTCRVCGAHRDYKKDSDNPSRQTVRENIEDPKWFNALDGTWYVKKGRCLIVGGGKKEIEEVCLGSVTGSDAENGSIESILIYPTIKKISLVNHKPYMYSLKEFFPNLESVAFVRPRDNEYYELGDYLFNGLWSNEVRIFGLKYVGVFGKGCFAFVDFQRAIADVDKKTKLSEERKNEEKRKKIEDFKDTLQRLNPTTDSNRINDDAFDA